MGIRCVACQVRRRNLIIVPFRDPKDRVPSQGQSSRITHPSNVKKKEKVREMLYNGRKDMQLSAGTGIDYV